MNIISNRNSNIEGLRIISIFLVLMLHVNYYSLGVPTYEQFQSNHIQVFFRCLFETIAIPSVNLFVLISGWFGINFKPLSLAKLIYQTIFLIFIVTAIGLIIYPIKVDNIYTCFIPFSGAWFIRSYILLWLIAPIINKIIQNISERTFKAILIIFYTFQTILGFWPYNLSFIAGGYSTLSFIGLYLLARYVKIYKNNWDKKGLIIISISLPLLVVMNIFPIEKNIPNLTYLGIQYTNPLCISIALGALLFTACMPIRKSQFVNFVAASSYAVYVVHICTLWGATLYKNIAVQIFN